MTRTGVQGRDRDAAAARPCGASIGSLCLGSEVSSDVSTGGGAEAAARPPEEPASVALEPTRDAGSLLESARPCHSPHRAPPQENRPPSIIPADVPTTNAHRAVEGIRGGGAGQGKVTAQGRHGRGTNAGVVGGQNGSGETHKGVGLVLMDMDAVAAPAGGAGGKAGAPCRGGARACRDGVQLGECGRAEMTQETDSETAEGLAGGLRLDSRIRELISRGISDAQIVSKVKHIP